MASMRSPRGIRCPLSRPAWPSGGRIRRTHRAPGRLTERAEVSVPALSVGTRRLGMDEHALEDEAAPGRENPGVGRGVDTQPHEAEPNSPHLRVVVRRHEDARVAQDAEEDGRFAGDEAVEDDMVAVDGVPHGAALVRLTALAGVRGLSVLMDWALPRAPL